jgi:biopolymer transport protein ExbD
MGAAVAEASGSGRRSMVTGINITPMVDVVLVLLVIMMVSAEYVVQQSIKVDLPAAATGESSEASPTIVAIAKDGATFLNDAPIAEDALKSALRTAVRDSPDLSLVVSADREAHHGSVMRVIDLAREQGITSFAVHVESQR